MQTFVIQTESTAQTKAVKDALEALNVKMEPIKEIDNTPLPSHISQLLNKSLTEADNENFVMHEDFMEYVNTKYVK